MINNQIGSDLRKALTDLESAVTDSADAKTRSIQAETDAAEAVETANAANTKADSAFSFVAGVYLDPVATLADIETTYPTPTVNDKVFVKDTGKYYIRQNDSWFQFAELTPEPFQQLSEELAQKVSQSYVDNQITTQLSGVKGTYADLTALQSAKPTGDTGNYVLQSDGNVYNWNGSTWVNTGIQYQATGIADKSITEEKMSFPVIVGIRSKNLFDKSKATDGFYVSNSSGNLSASPTYSASEFIPVLPNTAYALSGTTCQLAFYNSNKTYISGIPNGVTNPITTPATASFVRLSMKLEEKNNVQFELGSTSTSYESFEPKLDESIIKRTQSGKSILFHLCINSCWFDNYLFRWSI